LKKFVKYFLAVVVLPAVLLFVILGAHPMVVEVVTIEPTTAQNYFVERGQVRNERSVNVFSLVGGEIYRVYVREGQTVNAGQAIAVVDSSSLVHEMEIIKMNNEAALVQIEHLQEDERIVRNRFRGDANANIRRSELNAISARMQNYQSQIDIGDVQIAHIESMISDSVIRSHVSGTISHLYIDDANIVDLTMPIAEIRTETDNLIEVFVSTFYIDEINIGDSVEMIFTRHHEDIVYTGSIHSIDNRVEVMMSVLGVEEHRVAVNIRPDTISNIFQYGFDVDVRFVTYSSENRMLVPRTAVFEENGDSMLYLFVDGIAVATPVELGTSFRTDVIVESGIAFDDTVIRNARQDGLSDGARVVLSDD